MMGDENAIGLVVCIHTHTLAHIQTNEKEGCFYWSNCTLALKWPVFYSECLPAGKEGWEAAKKKAKKKESMAL